MIIKGSSRGNPKQLARHLLRTDTNERVAVLALDNPSGDLREALDDWQLLTGLTNGSKGLYHANIDPDARYQMTPEQWQRATDVLAEELGLTGQPRAVILHEKHGRQHIHVVWQRTDTEREALISDSHNYRAHERASLRLEEEFGHEIVPGAHAKRERDKPRLREAFNHAEWQQAERTGEDPRSRKAVITEIFKSADNGAAFRAGLEERGYMLAQGDRRSFVVLDQSGEVYSLTRSIEGAKAKDVKERLADLPDLPTVAEARAFQKATRENLEKQASELFKPPEATAPPAEPETRSQTPLRSKFGPSVAGVAAPQPEISPLSENVVSRHAEEIAAHQRQGIRQLAERLGVSDQDTARAGLALLGSQFSDYRETLSPQQREAFDAYRREHQAALDAIKERHEHERQQLTDQQRAAEEKAKREQEERERLAKLDQLEARIKAQRESRRTRGKDRTRDDDDDFLQ